MRFFPVTVFLFSVPAIFVNAQSNKNPIITAVPTLLINDNAVTNGMGEIGAVATEYNNAAYFQNPALLARNKKVLTGYFTYIPWLRTLVPDINILHAGIVYSPDGKNGFSYSMCYKSMGKVTFSSPTGTTIEYYRPREVFNSIRYARALSNNFSIGIGYKYIYSQLNNNKSGVHAGDLGADYRFKRNIGERKDLRINLGAIAMNMGQKVSYYPGRYDFLPAVLKVGGMSSINKNMENNNTLTFSLAYQAQKLLVPSPYIADPSNNYEIIAGRDPNVGVAAGMFGSFTDAPGIPVKDAQGNYQYNPDGTVQIEKGSVLQEELNEIIHQFGMEARYFYSERDLSLAFRSGYFHDHEFKGNKKFITTGIGTQWKAFSLDLSYYIPIEKRHPLANTIIISLCYRFFK